MFNKKKKLILALTTLTILSVSTAMERYHTNHTTPEIVINNPWVRSAPTNAPALGLFMQINNNTDHDIKLLSANVSGYQRVELHRTVVKGDMMKMVEQEFMPIPAKGKLHLKPGSWHIMLISPESVPHKGDTVMIDLVFDNGLSKTVHAQVRKGKKMTGNHHRMMH